MLTLHKILKDQYSTAVSTEKIQADALYFCTDTLETFVGYIPLTSVVVAYDNESVPEEYIVGKVYINTEDFSIKIFDGFSLVTIYDRSQIITDVMTELAVKQLK